MKINNKLDAGPICNKFEIEINKYDNTEIISENFQCCPLKKFSMKLMT